MNALTPQRHNPPAPLAERRINIAMRTPQLVTSRSLLFIAGGVCVAFGILALWLEQLNSVPGDSLLAPPQTAEITDGGRAQSVFQTRLLDLIILSFGIVTLLLASQIYRFPLAVAVLVSVLFTGVFVAFLMLNHSNLAALYVLASLGMLGVLIKAVHSALQFYQSFARMGRPEDHLE